MRMNLNNDQCEMLLKKHGIEELKCREVFAALREAYRIGRDADAMRVVWKEKERKNE